MTRGPKTIIKVTLLHTNLYSFLVAARNEVSNTYYAIAREERIIFIVQPWEEVGPEAHKNNSDPDLLTATHKLPMLSNHPSDIKQPKRHGVQVDEQDSLCLKVTFFIL